MVYAEAGEHLARVYSALPPRGSQGSNSDQVWQLAYALVFVYFETRSHYGAQIHSHWFLFGSPD